MYKAFSHFDLAYLNASERPVFLARGAVGAELYYSEDGLNFTLAFTASATIGAIDYSPEANMFIAAELASPWEIHRSTDGKNWSSVVSPGSTTRGVRGATNLNGTFYLNRTSQVIASTDGINWTEYTRNGASNSVGIATNGSIWVIGTDSTTTQRLQSSPDLTTWTNRLDSGVRSAVHWVDDFGLFIVFNNTVNYFTSPDGITWTTHTVPSKGTSNSRYPIGAYSPKLGIFVMCNADNGLRWSSNGTTFTLATLPGGYTGRPQSVFWSDKFQYFVAYGNTDTNAASDIVLKSVDGKTWTQHTANITLDAVQCAAKTRT
jgi:hypothetical protein